MSGIFFRFVLNQKYLIKYYDGNVNIFEIIQNNKINLLFKFTTNANISSIEFNPLIHNIILISFDDGTCKIYNILKHSGNEDIIFESMKNEMIKFSLFNIYNPNIIASMTKSMDLYIWDVRKLYYLNLLHIKEDIQSLNWSFYGSDYLETISENNTIGLIDINKNEFKSKEKVEGQIIDCLYLKEDILILIKVNKAEKINFKNKTTIGTKNFESTNKSIKDLVKNYNILIILENNKLHFIDIDSFSTIKEVTLPIGFPTDYFFYVKGENEIGYKYINHPKFIFLPELTFEVKMKKSEKNKDQDLINISNNFYEKFYPKILKNMCILSFKENIYDKPNYRKKYMYIDEISEFFDKIKEINIFDRKYFVTQLFDYKIVDNKIVNLNDELNIKNFQIIRKFIKLFKIDKIKSRKDEFNEMSKNNLDDKTIIDFYLEIIMLLSIDNTNEKLLEIYLLFIQLYEKYLIRNFGETKIEKYKDENSYYSVCFSKEDYQELFDLDKDSERESLFKFLNEINKFDNFDYDNSEFKNYIDKFRKENTQFPDFNQPIEYDCNNSELKWYSIKSHIFIAFQRLKINEKNQDLLQDIREGVRVVMDNKLLEIEDILENKYKLQSVIFLITNPCSSDNEDLQFFCNSLLSKRNDIKKLKDNNYNLIDEKQLIYKNEKFENVEDICLTNLSFNLYSKEEKYNFDYLLNNYVENKEKIKKFLNNILHKKVFIDAYKILFGDNNYENRYKKYLEEFVNKRLEFVPIRPRRASALSDKISLNTFISTQNYETKLKRCYKLKPKNIRKVLTTAKYVLNEEHEIFHLINCIPYYENNFSISINTPRKGKLEGYEDESEGGIYLELLLFNKEIKLINLADAFFLLNEKNYDKSQSDFMTSFEKKNKDDLIIEGVFSDFNNYVDIQNMPIEELNNYYIKQKSSSELDSVLDSYIVNELKNDIVGKRPNKKI